MISFRGDVPRSADDIELDAEKEGEQATAEGQGTRRETGGALVPAGGATFFPSQLT